MDYLFETRHLRVRPFKPEDAERLYANHCEDAVKKWIPNESYADLNEAAWAIRFYRDCVDRKALPYVLAVESRESGLLIGDTGINEVDGHPGEVEIGYTVCQAYSGRGYATELVAAMAAFCEKELHVRVLYGRVMRGNDASVRVLEKNGVAFVRMETGAEDDPEGRGVLVYRKAL